MDWNIFTEILLIIALLIAVILSLVTVKGPRKQDPLYMARYKVKVHFAHGIHYKMTLNDEQYEQLLEFLKQVDGYFEIGDEIDNVKIYRDLICLVEVKKK